MISSTLFMTMVDALELIHGSHVDVIAVVPSAGPVSQRTLVDLLPRSLQTFKPGIHETYLPSEEGVNWRPLGHRTDRSNNCDQIYMSTMCQLKGIDHGHEKGARNHLLLDVFLILELQLLLPRNFWVGMDALLCNMCRWMHIYIQGASCINGRSPNASIAGKAIPKEKTIGSQHLPLHGRPNLPINFKFPLYLWWTRGGDFYLIRWFCFPCT